MSIWNTEGIILWGKYFVSIWNTEGIILLGEILCVDMDHWRDNTVGAKCYVSIWNTEEIILWGECCVNMEH